MNTVEERRIERGIGRVLAHFGVDERPAVRVFLLKQVYGIKWRAVGIMVGLDAGSAFRLAEQGRRLLERAKSRRRLDRDELCLQLAAEGD